MEYVFRGGKSLLEDLVQKVEDLKLTRINTSCEYFFFTRRINWKYKTSFYTGISEHYSSALSDSTNRERQDGNSRFIPSFGAKLYANANRVWHYNEELSTTNADLGKNRDCCYKTCYTTSFIISMDR